MKHESNQTILTQSNQKEDNNNNLICICVFIHVQTTHNHTYTFSFNHKIDKFNKKRKTGGCYLDLLPRNGVH